MLHPMVTPTNLKNKEINFNVISDKNKKFK